MEWISVKDKLPEQGQLCFVYIKGQGRAAAFYRYWDHAPIGHWDFPRYDCDVFNWEGAEVSYWHLPPDVPKEILNERT